MNGIFFCPWANEGCRWTTTDYYAHGCLVLSLLWVTHPNQEKFDYINYHYISRPYNSLAELVLE